MTGTACVSAGGDASSNLKPAALDGTFNKAATLLKVFAPGGEGAVVDGTNLSAGLHPSRGQRDRWKLRRA
jgi:hypothetical protein